MLGADENIRQKKYEVLKSMDLNRIIVGIDDGTIDLSNGINECQIISMDNTPVHSKIIHTKPNKKKSAPNVAPTPQNQPICTDSALGAADSRRYKIEGSSV